MCLNITIAYNNRKNKNGDKSSTFRDCVAFGKTAENIERNFSKGSPILVIGRIEDEEYTAKDGSNKRKSKFYINDFNFPMNAVAKDGATNELRTANVPF
jgi:single-strand DNA-binding protein